MVLRSQKEYSPLMLDTENLPFVGWETYILNFIFPSPLPSFATILSEYRLLSP